MNIGSRKNQRSFAQVPSVNIQRSKFDRSFAIKDTFDFDNLNPVFVDEVLPGDSVNINMKAFLRLATQVKPVMDNMYVDYFFFYVPTRLTWSNWEKFNGEQTDPSDSTDYTIPTITINDGSGFQVGSIYDKMGIPTDVDDITINALPLRAYNLIYNEWFRDQNLIDSVDTDLDDGPDAATDYTILKRGKRHDYFTSCLPWPYKADNDVLLPLGTSAPVSATTDYPISSNVFRDRTNGNAIATNDVVSAGGGVITNQAGTLQGFIDPADAYFADLENATAATINELRDAMLTQSLYELDARGGTRYTEIIRAHFGVISDDARLQRPEFLSSGQIKIAQHPVAQTSESNTTDQANLAAFSTGMMLDNRVGFSKSFTEHGYIICLAAARADLTYQQGIERMWSRSTRLDFFWPKLQQLGEQEVLNKEIYAQGLAADDEVFGYQERYAEYRYKPSLIKGEFRSTYATSLDVWHLAEEFGSLPSLNQTFIESNTPIERALAVTTDVHILADMWFHYICARPMMTYGVPATLGRF
jgi:hypothetical protein